VISHREILRLVAVLAVLGSASANAADDWQAGAGSDWQSVLAAAKKEGKVAVAGPPELAGPLTEGFKSDTGIEVEYLAGEARDRSSRVGREVRNGNVTLDFIFTGAVELPLVKEGFFEDEKAKLMLPGVTDPKKWKNGGPKWVDNTKKYMLQGQGLISSIPLYDGNAIKPGEFTSWKDLLDPKFKGKIVAYDPRSGGPGVATAGYIGATMGMDYLKQLYIGQEVVYSTNSRQMVEWIARGVYKVALGVTPADYQTMVKAGLKNIIPADLKDGHGSLSGGFSVVLVPKGAPHPNAATVFLNWYASVPGQTAFGKALKNSSLRTDVPDDPTMPEYTIPKAGVDYQDQYSEDFVLNVRAKVVDEVNQAFGGK
jgi:ABC-type Fe3+ transport system substrate-binding protein